MEEKNLIKIYEAKNQMEAELFKGFLTNEGIEVFIQPDYTSQSSIGIASAHIAVPDTFKCPYLILVPKNKAKEAVKLLEKFKKV